MKVLLVIHEYFPDFAAGTEVLTRSVARELRSLGHDVEIFTGHPSSEKLNDDERLDNYDHEGFHVHRFHHSYEPGHMQRSSVALGYDNQLAARLFADLLITRKPDLVHFFHFSRLGTGLIEACVRAGVPAFFTPTDFWTVCPKVRLRMPDGSQCAGPSKHGGNCVSHFIKELSVDHASMAYRIGRKLPIWLVDTMAGLTASGWMPGYPQRDEVSAINARLSINIARLKQLHRILPPTRFMHELLLRHGIPESQMVHVAFGVEEATSLQHRRAQRPPGPLRLAFVGTLSEHKGCHIAVEAVMRLPTELVELTIFGGEMDSPEYARQLKARTNAQTNIRFCGTFPNEKIREVLHQFDAVVMPSLWVENTPLVMFSARAAGCVVLGSDFPGISEVVKHEVDGMLFAAGDATAASRQIQRLATEPNLLSSLQSNIPPPSTTSLYVDRLMSVWLE